MRILIERRSSYYNACVEFLEGQPLTPEYHAFSQTENTLFRVYLIALKFPFVFPQEEPQIMSPDVFLTKKC